MTRNSSKSKSKRATLHDLMLCLAPIGNGAIETARKGYVLSNALGHDKSAAMATALAASTLEAINRIVEEHKTHG
jgi:hypothetical protein